MKDLSRLREQVKAAWAKLPPDVKAKLEPKIRAAHLHALAVRNKTVSAVARPPHRELLMLHSLLNDDPDGLLAASAGGIYPPYVGPDGQVYYAGVKYDSTDFGWAYCLVAVVFTDQDTTPQFTVGNVMPIPDNTTLAILGDWGGWNAPAQSVVAAAQSCDYLIHLGDVYYAGTNSDGGWLDPYESSHFIDVWPGAAGKSFALNSNHDMYANATGYALTLGQPTFAAQGGNCFALYNKAFRIVGLDTAYYAPDSSIENFPGYMIGSLGDPSGAQAQFLQQQIQQVTSGQTLILLTHHNGLNQDGSLPGPSDDGSLLWGQVTTALKQLPASANQNVLWYWGHVHAGAVYASQTIPGGGPTINSRCCGHGCIPWGIATEMQASNVLWFENTVVPSGPASNYFVNNGYAVLALNGTSLTETFHDQIGNQAWPVPPKAG